MNKKKIFSEEFKRNAVTLSDNSEKSLQEVANEIGIAFSTLCKWRTMYPIAKTNKAEHAKKFKDPEILKLKKENERLKMENEILKKATAFFAKENY